MNIDHTDIFVKLRNWEKLAPDDPQAYRMREASFFTKKLLVEMNKFSNPEEIRDLLSQITGTLIYKSTTVFTLLSINYGKHTKIGKNVFINFNCISLDLGGIIIEDNVLIVPSVNLLSKGHPITTEKDNASRLNLSISKRMHG